MPVLREPGEELKKSPSKETKNELIKLFSLKQFLLASRIPYFPVFLLLHSPLFFDEVK